MINIKILKFPFRNSIDSYYQCPTCNNGQLKIKGDTFCSNETRKSITSPSHPDFDADYVSYVYSCLFECTNSACKEIVASSGYGFVDWDIEVNDEGYQEQIYSDYFRPLHFHPALKIIDIPKNVPDEVKSIIENSFTVFFISPSSCVNHIRTSLEAVLTDLKIPKSTIGKNKKRQLLSLHSRISKLPTKYDNLKEILFALKWLGNSGSHTDSNKVSMSDAIDAYEFLDYLLSEVYEEKSEKIKKKAKKINKTKGIK